MSAEIAVLILITVTPLALILPSGEVGLVTLVGIGGGLYLFVRGFRVLTRKRLLLNTLTSKIRSASLGLVEVSGVAVGPYTLAAPITGVPCFLYRTTAWQKSDETKTGEWKRVAEETLHVPFFLDDKAGQLLIEPTHAELDLHLAFRQNYSDTIFCTHATPQVLSFLARHGVEPSNQIRIEECCIQPLHPLFVVGTLAENPGIAVWPLSGSATYRGVFSAGQQRPLAATRTEVVRLSETAISRDGRETTQQSKLAAALTRAGISRPEAWEAAGMGQAAALAERGSLREMSIGAEEKPPLQRDGSPFDLTPPVVLMKGENNPAFLISWHSQQDLIQSLAWKSSAMIWGGGALALLGLYVLLQQWELF